MTTTRTELPPLRPFTLEECDALISAGIITDGERAAVLAGLRLFNVDEFLDMEKVGILHEDDRIELMDGKIIVMAPIGDSHVFGTDWLTMILAPLFAGLAMVRIGGPIYLNDRSAPQPDVAVVRMFHTVEEAHSHPTMCTSSSRSPTAPCDTTAAPNWPATLPPASPRSGSPPAGARGGRIHQPVRFGIRELHHPPTGG